MRNPECQKSGEKKIGYSAFGFSNSYSQNRASVSHLRQQKTWISFARLAETRYSALHQVHVPAAVFGFEYLS